ncbi:MAG: hypothetical protein JNK25_03480 [Phycisphaerae bacterium]|nr:hypothetical protein [Phycisphaerae bacterium]
MKKEAKLLFDKAMNSLILSIDHFNRPWDRGRTDAVLIFLNHSFEMLLKSALLHKGGRIREKRAKQTIGFDASVRKALSDSSVKFLTDEQAMTLQTINSLRDAAEHHLVDLSEQHLAIQMMAGLTLFRDICNSVFGKNISEELPKRAIAVSTTPPTDLATLFSNEMEEVKMLLKPGKRRLLEAQAKLRGLAIVEGSVQGERVQPSEGELSDLGKAAAAGTKWDMIFPGIAAITLTAKGFGPSLDLRFSKKEGIPIVVVPENTPGAAVVAIKRVNELDFYSLGRDDIAKKIGLSGPKTTALIRYSNIQTDSECFKKIQVGSARFDRYSQKAISKLVEVKAAVNMDDVWRNYRSSTTARGAG